MRKPIPLVLLFLTLCLLSAAPSARAQLDGAPVLSAAQIAQRIAPLHPKILVMVFDVTMSTMHNNVFGLERAGAATLIEDGCSVGDRVALIQFGTGYTVDFDQVLADNADKQTLVNEIPGHVVPGHGTNIRYPHVAALEMVQKYLPRRKAVIVLMTDSFNDRPLLSDPNYPNYLAYYSLKSLTIYPHTPQNREYVHLLNTLVLTGEVKQYGIGVGYAPDGRPIERLPKAGEGDSYVPPSAATSVAAQQAVGTEQVHSSPLPWIIGLLFLLLLLWLLWSRLNRAVPLRLALGDKGAPRDYRLRPGAKVGFGGSAIAVAPGDEVFPLAGVSTPLAYAVAGRGGSLSLTPASAEPVNGLEVLHNGAALEHAVPLRVGDETRITLPPTETNPAREYRVRVVEII
jgi:hypothetical protein